MSENIPRARSAVCRKQVLPSLGAPTDHRPSPSAGEEAAAADRELIRRRAEAVAEAAALRFEESCGGRVYCTFVGQLRVERDDWPRLTDCERDSERWAIPRWIGSIRLLFKWDIIEHGRVTESDNSVVTLNDAAQKGAPLPNDWGRLIADVAGSVLAPKGVC